MFERIEYYLNPINLIKGIVNFFLRRDILQILVLYSLAKYIWINGFFKEYSPAKNYYITDLGLNVDYKLREVKWNQDIDDSEKSEKELCQKAEFKKLKKQFDI